MTKSRNGHEVAVKAGQTELPGHLTIPEKAKALVVFAHGSGSNRRSPRNAKVAEGLNRIGLATLVFDLLTEKEQEKYDANVFDMDLLTERLQGAVKWAQKYPETIGMALGLCGASTGAGAALNVAAELGKDIAAVVSRGGRPDLADQKKLPQVTADVLMVVGGDDAEVIPMNESAAANLTGAKHEIKLVPGATHVFAEPGTLEQAAEMTADWFGQRLGREKLK